MQQPLALAMVSKELYFPNMKYLRNCCHFYSFDIFSKIVKIMKKISVLIAKYTTWKNFLVSDALTYLYNVKFDIK